MRLTTGNNCVFVEYIWLDGNRITKRGPWEGVLEPGIRTKTRNLILPDDDYRQLPNVGENIPADQVKEIIKNWSFDGSSTGQATGDKSDCILKPVRVYYDYYRTKVDQINCYLVLCEVLSADGSPHPTNTRAKVCEDPTQEYIFAFEQEYFLFDSNSQPILSKMYQNASDTFGGPPQFGYYCGVGARYIHPDARKIADEHAIACLAAGISHEGINHEVAPGQCECQILGKGALAAADDLIIARYLLETTAERYGVIVNLHPKAMGPNWNGSGMHTNFSNKTMREQGSKELLEAICESFRPKDRITKHIRAYGSDNDLRLTGKHETQSIHTFSYGISDRGASIRIPISNVVNNYRNAYLEDRRPASNADPYQIVQVIMESVGMAFAKEKRSASKSRTSIAKKPRRRS